ncbi:hypothetical protein KP77_20740 [Jeotgalibacillus alimentarius]|uniref:Uncharacterized protein n=1 Tax=Jeotgalibacillus alimentarius TaxID=135826 RepID=A0A0C2VJ00_9BACL|nr:hypothetical protein KP77_20740 [Jeotgalibacillus alimentarius]
MYPSEYHLKVFLFLLLYCYHIIQAMIKEVTEFVLYNY